MPYDNPPENDPSAPSSDTGTEPPPVPAPAPSGDDGPPPRAPGAPAEETDTTDEGRPAEDAARLNEDDRPAADTGTAGDGDRPTGDAATPDDRGRPTGGTTATDDGDRPAGSTTATGEDDRPAGGTAAADEDDRPAEGAGTTGEGGRAAEDTGTAHKGVRPAGPTGRADGSGGGPVATVDDPAVVQPTLDDAAIVPAAPRPGGVPLPDPISDLEQRRREAGVDEQSPFGRPGLPLGKAHPFIFGFIGALGVFTAWMLIQAITSARHVLVLIVVALFLAIGLNPAVEALQRTRLPRSGAVAVVFAGVILVFVGFGSAIVPPLSHQITEFIEEVPTYIAQLQQNERVRDFDQRYQVLKKVQDAVTNPDFGQTALDGVVGVGRQIISGVFNVLSVLIMTLYFLSSLPMIKNFFYRLAPRSRRARVALLGDEILLRIGGYVAGTVTVATIAGTVAYIFMLIMGIPFALPLALFVGLTALIPLVGATIGAILVCTVAFFVGPATGIVAVIFFVVYQQVENYLIHPRVMKRAVDVQPAVTIIAALIGGSLLGIIGALLAIPTAAAISLIVREVVLPRQETL